MSILACPSCGATYDAVSHQEAAEEIEQGYLRCECRAAVIPIIDGFAMFTEPVLNEALANPDALRRMAQRFFRTAEGFERYLRDKRTRNIIEPYAAFHPFIESGRAAESLLPHLLGNTRPGSFILDPWCRTGWSGEWLAGRLPARRIVCLWEGDSSVLGYRGFRYLLGTGRRAANLDILFSHPGRPLPFRAGAFDFLYSLDALHRFGSHRFAEECLRVTHPGGGLLFAHVHLANGEPEPFFERGGEKIHGRDYRAWLDRITAGGPRRGFVFSEARLFDGPPLADLVDDSSTSHYNGLVAILAQNRPTRAPDATSPRACFMVNPMFRIDIARGTATMTPQLYDGAVAKFLARHPIYGARLAKDPIALDGLAMLALFLAAAGAQRARMHEAVPDRQAEMELCLGALSRAELLRPAPVSAAAHYLQRIHANQYASGILDGKADWLRRLRHDDTHMIGLDDGTLLAGKDIAEFAARLCGYLRTHRVSPSDRIVVSAGAQPLLWIAAVAAASAGVDVRLHSGAVAASTPGTLWLCDDQQAASGAGLRLGLDGSPGGLLAELAMTAPAYDAEFGGTGVIEFDLGRGIARCPVAMLAAGCSALQNQRERRSLVLGGEDPLRDLLSVLSTMADASIA